MKVQEESEGGQDLSDYPIDPHFSHSADLIALIVGARPLSAPLTLYCDIFSQIARQQSVYKLSSRRLLA